MASTRSDDLWKAACRSQTASRLSLDSVAGSAFAHSQALSATTVISLTRSLFGCLLPLASKQKGKDLTIMEGWKRNGQVASENARFRTSTPYARQQEVKQKVRRMSSYKA